MGFLTFLKRGESENIGAMDRTELPPLPNVPSQKERAHVAELGLPPMPTAEPEEMEPELKPLGPPIMPPPAKGKEEIPTDIPSLKGGAPRMPIPEPPGSPEFKEEPLQLDTPQEPEIPTSGMDEAPEFPSLDEYMEKEEIKEDIPPLKLKEPAEIETPLAIAIPEKPIFLTLGKYKSILETISETNVAIEESVNTLLRLVDVKIPLDGEYGKLNEVLGDAERKLAYVDKLFFEKEI